MSDMIEAKDAKKQLNCDDAALNNHINSGAIRAQRQGGKLMLNQDDVAKLAKDKDDDGTIVLTGDSDDLSIDLGKVVDDSAETMIQGHKPATDSASGTESITFGEELEVVSFDDHHTSELVFDETKQTGQVQNLSFTDSNTAVMTAVDETSVGATTAPIEFQTGSASSVQEPRRGDGNSSSRRSARSARVEPEDVKVHWIWPALLIATAIFMLGFAMPYYVLAMYPKGPDLTDAAKNQARGLADNGWTKMAAGVAGFTVEPSQEKWKLNPDNAGGGEYKDIKNVDTQADWRFRKYLNGKATYQERFKDFTVITVEGDGDAMRANTSPGNALPMRKSTAPVQGAEQKPIEELIPVTNTLYGK